MPLVARAAIEVTFGGICRMRCQITFEARLDTEPTPRSVASWVREGMEPSGALRLTPICAPAVAPDSMTTDLFRPPTMGTRILLAIVV